MRRHVSVLPIVLLGAVLGCGGNDEPSGKTAGGESVPVKVFRVVTQSAEEPVQYSASIGPVEEANIGGKVMGKVERILVSEGDAVRKGELLIRLESEDVQAKLAQAEAAVVEARAHFENAKRNLERFESLFTQKAATQKELEDVRVAYESDQARLDAAQEMRREVEELLQHVEVVAPFAGVVTKTYLDVGDLATPAQPILKLENIDRLEVVASVPESQIEHLSVGMPVKIVIPAHTAEAGEEEFTGSIDQIVPSADPASHQFEIKVFIQNPGGSVMSGMFARLVISRALTERLMVPQEAIHHRGQLEGIFVVGEDSRVHLRWVRTGRTISGWVEILAGLDPGETVVTASGSRLEDGERVEVTR